MSTNRSTVPTQRINLNILLPSLVAGLVVAMVGLPIGISLAALIFSGDLSPFLASGIGFLLAGVVVFGLVIGALSSHRGMMGVTQDAPAVIVAVMAAAIAARMADAPPETIFLTVVGSITAASLLTGLAFLALGWFRLGDLIRYVPYPVIGGFLAGTGWLLAVGGLNVMIELPSSLAALPGLLEPARLIGWLPGLAFAVALLLATRRIQHFLVVPGLIVGGTLLFYGFLAVTGRSIEQAASMGLLLGPFPAGRLWQLPPLAALLGVDWGVIFSQAGQFLTLIIISALALLLNASGIEVTSRQDIDLNRELRGSGVANLGAALVGSTPGFAALSLSTLATRMGAGSRLVGVVYAGVALLVLLFGAPVLGLLPRAVVGGLVLFLGLTLLVEWVIEAWFRLARSDYLIVIVILTTIALFGPLAGVGLGIVLAAAKFLVDYSRTNAIKVEWDGVRYASRVERSPQQQQALSQQVDQVFILELQGFIFFGTANQLFERVRSRYQAADRSPPRFVVLDFRRVSNIDASAMQSFIKIGRLNPEQPPVLVLSQLAAPIMQRLQQELDSQGQDIEWRSFPNLDYGLEWCEDRILQTIDHASAPTAPLDAAGAGVGRDSGQEPGGDVWKEPSSFPFNSLLPYLQRIQLAAGEVLFRQGELAPGLFYLDSGQLEAVAQQPDGAPLRLSRMADGTVVGELSVYLRRPTGANIVATVPSTVYLLPITSIGQIEQENPGVANQLNRYLIELLGRRVVENLDYVRALTR